MNDYEYMQHWLDSESDNYEPVEKILNDIGVSYDEALSEAKGFRSRFFELLKNKNIPYNNISQVITDICGLTEHDKSGEAVFLYTAIAVEKGLLFGKADVSEQYILWWLEQNKKTELLTKIIADEQVYSKRLADMKLSTSQPCNVENFGDEQALLYRMAKQHRFLNINDRENIFLENVGELIRCVESDAEFRKIKPYIYSAVLSRKHKYMTGRRNYSPNIRDVFKRNGYKIDEDNGKNFDTYQSYLELYEQLKRHYTDECDIEFSDYCFANLSNLSEWYYENCEPNEDIPMSLEYAFSYFTSYIDLGIIETDGNYPVLEIAYENLLSDDEKWQDFISAMQNGSDVEKYCERLYINANAVRICPDKRIALNYARAYLLMFMENHNRRLIINAAKQFR